MFYQYLKIKKSEEFLLCIIYSVKLFPYLKNIDSYFIKLISRYSSENLDIALFLVQLKLILSKPDLKKARKASQFSKRSSKE